MLDGGMLKSEEPKVAVHLINTFPLLQVWFVRFSNTFNHGQHSVLILRIPKMRDINNDFSNGSLSKKKKQSLKAELDRQTLPGTGSMGLQTCRRVCAGWNLGTMVASCTLLISCVMANVSKHKPFHRSINDAVLSWILKTQTICIEARLSTAIFVEKKRYGTARAPSLEQRRDYRGRQ